MFDSVFLLVSLSLSFVNVCAIASRFTEGQRAHLGEEEHENETASMELTRVTD